MKNAWSGFSILDAILNTMYLLRTLEGPSVYLPDNILNSMINIDLLSLVMDNPFEQLAASTRTCKPSAGFVKAGFQCNYLLNDGLQIIQLSIVTIFCLLITIILTVIIVRRKKKEALKRELPIGSITERENLSDETLKIVKAEIDKRKKTKLEFVKQALGFQLLMIKLENNQVEYMLNCLIALKYATNCSADIAGCILAGLLLVGYCGTACCHATNIRWIWKKVKELKENRTNDNNFGGKPLEELIDLRESPFTPLIFVFEGSNPPRKFIHLLMPIFNFLRSIILVILAVFVIGRPVLQISLMASIETSILIVTAVFNDRTSKIEFFVDLLIRLFTALYLLFKAITTSEDVGDSFRQNNLGIPMVVFIILIISISVLFLLLVIGSFLFQCLRRYLKSRKQKNKLLPLPRSVSAKPKMRSLARMRSSAKVARINPIVSFNDFTKNKDQKKEILKPDSAEAMISRNNTNDKNGQSASEMQQISKMNPLKSLNVGFGNIS